MPSGLKVSSLLNVNMILIVNRSNFFDFLIFFVHYDI